MQNGCFLFLTLEVHFLAQLGGREGRALDTLERIHDRAGPSVHHCLSGLLQVCWGAKEVTCRWFSNCCHVCNNY